VWKEKNRETGKLQIIQLVITYSPWGQFTCGDGQYGFLGYLREHSSLVEGGRCFDWTVTEDDAITFVARFLEDLE
jgi:hypothetical protein